MRTSRSGFIASILASLTCLVLSERQPAHGLINTFRPETLGAVIARCDSVSIMKVDDFSKEKAVIIYKKVKDLKGTFPGDGLKEHLGAAHHPYEKDHYLDWLKKGNEVVVFYYEKRVIVCIGDQWTVCEDPKGPPKEKGEIWTVTTRTEPFFNMSYYGDVKGMSAAVKRILDGKEVVVPCMFGERDKELRERKGKLIRMRTHLKQKKYDLKRDRVTGDEKE